jgi:hypothetical protein
MTASPEPPAGTGVDRLMFAPCSHAPGLLAWLEGALRPLPFAMCFSAAEERSGGILELPNGFLKTLVTQHSGEELDRYAASAGFDLLEAHPGDELGRGVEVVERLVDTRLLASLGTQRPVGRVAQELRVADDRDIYEEIHHVRQPERGRSRPYRRTPVTRRNRTPGGPRPFANASA